MAFWKQVMGPQTSTTAVDLGATWGTPLVGGYRGPGTLGPSYTNSGRDPVHDVLVARKVYAIPGWGAANLQFCEGRVWLWEV